MPTAVAQLLNLLAESKEDAMRPWHAKRGTATEHASLGTRARYKRRNASSSAGKGDRRVKAKVKTHDDDSENDYYAEDYGARGVQSRGNATEHAKRRNASSSAGKGDRRVKAKVKTHDDDSETTTIVRVMAIAVYSPAVRHIRTATPRSSRTTTLLQSMPSSSKA